MNDENQEAAKPWKVKAENDWKTVEILRADPEAPADSICFHCQQLVEKLLKGMLTLHGVEAPRTHDLKRLIQAAEMFAPELTLLKDTSDALTAHAVQSRYPDDWRKIEEEEIQEIVDLAKKFRAIILPLLER